MRSSGQYVSTCSFGLTAQVDQISRATGAVSETIKKSTEPIRNTAAYQSLSETLIDALDDSGSAKHAGFEEKEARRLRRQRRLIKAGKDSGIGPASKRTAANPECVSASHPCSILLIHRFQSWLVCHSPQGLAPARKVEPAKRDKPLPADVRVVAKLV